MADKTTAENRSSLADILLLQQRLRNATDISRLGHLLVNDTLKLVRYRTAVLWLFPLSRKRVKAVSGIPRAVDDAPFTVWADRVCRHICKKQEICQFTAADIPDNLSVDWHEYFPANAIWLPLCSPAGKDLGGMLLAGEEMWSKEEENFLQYWMEASAYSIDYLDRHQPNVFRAFRSLKSKIWGVIALVAIACLWLPVHISVLAPAEVVPVNPVVIRAPLDGVIDQVLVRPNQLVSKGTLLIQLDDTSLRSRLDIAGQILEIARAELRRAEQASVIDKRAAAQLPMLQAKVDQRLTETTYIKSLLERIEIKAEMDGVVMLPDSHKLEGRPVSIGEKIMLLASPKATEIEAWLAAGDSIPLRNGARIDLFLNISPQTATPATVDYVHYQAEVSQQGILAFRVKGNFVSETSHPRIGLRGTAKLYGTRVPLYYYLFRRPFAATRQWLGI